MKHIDTYLSVKQARDTLKGINPSADIVRIWMGDSWPNNDVRKMVVCFENHPPKLIPHEPNPEGDSFIEFSDGHMIVARTHEQATGNPPPRFGKAVRGTGKESSPAGKRRKKR